MINQQDARAVQIAQFQVKPTVVTMWPLDVVRHTAIHTTNSLHSGLPVQGT